MIPEDVKERIRRESDIEAVIGASVALKRRGRSLVGLCPFHSENTPSFTVNTERQFFHCFGCKESGDVFTFLEKAQGMTFVEALRYLGEQLGIEVVDEHENNDQWRKAKERKERELDVLDRAAAYFERQLRTPAGARHLEYLGRRGFGDDAIRKFRLGFAPGGSKLIDAASSQGTPPRALVAVGLASRRDADAAPGIEDNPAQYRDFFFDRLMFPIEDDRGRVVAFGGRTLTEGGPKYLNSRETELFRKSATLYGYSLARREITRQKRVVLMEGYTDVIAAHMAGFGLAVATLGTALTEEHARMLRRNVSRVDLVYDGDRAGLEAARRGIEVLMSEGMSARVVILPDGLDPCELLMREGGTEQFAALLDGGLEPIDFIVTRAGETWDPTTVDGKASAIRDCLAYTALADDLQQDILLDRIAAEFSVGRGSLQTAFDEVTASHARQVSRERKGQRQGRGTTSGSRAGGLNSSDLGAPPPLEDPDDEAWAPPPPPWDDGSPQGEVAQPARLQGERQHGPRAVRRRPETVEEGIVSALLVRPDLIHLAEEKLAPSTVREEQPALADLLELAFDLHSRFTPDTVIELSDDPEVLGVVERLRGRLDEERAAAHLSDCLARLEQRTLAEDRARHKFELLQRERGERQPDRGVVEAAVIAGGELQPRRTQRGGVLEGGAADDASADAESQLVASNQVDPSDIDPSDIDPSDIDPSDIDPSDIDPSDINRSDIDRSDINPSDINRSDINRSDIEVDRSAEDEELQRYQDGVRESPPRFVPVSLRRKNR